MRGDGGHQPEGDGAGGPQGEDPGEAGGLQHSGADGGGGPESQSGLCHPGLPCTQATVEQERWRSHGSWQADQLRPVPRVSRDLLSYLSFSKYTNNKAPAF